MDELVLGGHRFTSRLVVGTGKYKDFPTMNAALQASGAGMVTVAVRRLDLKARGEASLLHWIPKDMVLLPNTAGCFTAEDAVRTCRLARELQLGGENRWSSWRSSPTRRRSSPTSKRRWRRQGSWSRRASACCPTPTTTRSRRRSWRMPVARR